MCDVMASNESLHEKVSQWLAQQGYPLEMQVAAALRRIDLSVRQATHYVDSESGKSREIDVIATDAEPLGMAEIHFVVECKASSKPWILFTSRHTLHDYNHLFALGICSDGARSALIQKVEDLGAALPWFRKDGRVGYNLTEAFTGGADNAYGTATAAVKACLFLLQPKAGYTPPLIFTFPAIVIESPLFECFLDDSGTVSLTQVEQGWLFFDVRLPEFKGTCVKVVSQSGLSQYCTEVRSMKDSLCAVIAPNVEQEWRALEEMSKRLKRDREYPGGST